MNTTARWLPALDSRLLVTSALALLLALPCFAFFLIDDRQVGGLNTWIKPLKFALSFGIYGLTVAFLLPLLPAGLSSKLSWAFAGVIVIELAAITTQAARGRQSHHNVGAPLDGFLYGSMGVAIVVNTLLIALLAYWFCTKSVALERHYVRAIQWGLGLLLLSAAVGAAMSLRFAHTVGGPDGGPGLPFVGWSTVVGDLRVAHFLSMHGIQALLVVAFAIERGKFMGPSVGNTNRIIDAGGLVLTALTVVLTALAFDALSPFAWLAR